MSADDHLNDEQFGANGYHWPDPPKGKCVHGSGKCRHETCAYERGDISMDESNARMYEMPLNEYQLLKRAFEIDPKP